jgi:hypothetical protein
MMNFTCPFKLILFVMIEGIEVQFEPEVFNFKGTGGIALEVFNQWNSIRPFHLSMCIC